MSHARGRPKEFRGSVVAVARRGSAPTAQLAKDRGISEPCLRSWRAAAADVASGARPGVTASQSAELGELKRLRRLLEQENRTRSERQCPPSPPLG
jgi:transposase